MDYENRHTDNILKLVNRIEALYNGLANDISKIVAPVMRLNIPWEKLPQTRRNEILKAIQKKLDALGTRLNSEISSAINNAVSLSEEKHNEFLKATLAGYSVAKASTILSKLLKKQAKFDVNKAVKLYLQATSKNIDGLVLSERVWNIANGNIDTIQHYLRSGFGNGKSAVQLSKDLRTFLKEPERLFRRIRNDDGKLILSSPAKDYHPGQGVYRSSFKNARRLAATETNRAYRMADYHRWQQNEVVVGFEVKLSGRHKIDDICDHAKGEYPKGFKFTGWHPQCFCYAVPITLKDDEFDEYVDSILEEKPFDTSKSNNHVNDVPASFKNWISDNTDRIKKMKKQPFFVKDNFTGGTIDKGLNI